MIASPPRQCTAPGCRAVTRSSRCPAHFVSPSGSRDPVYKGARWAGLRRQVFGEEPVCRACGRPGQDSDHVDHISSRRVELAAGRDPERRSNLQRLCASCHGRKTVEHDGAFGNPKRRP